MKGLERGRDLCIIGQRYLKVLYAWVFRGKQEKEIEWIRGRVYGVYIFDGARGAKGGKVNKDGKERAFIIPNGTRFYR